MKTLLSLLLLGLSFTVNAGDQISTSWRNNLAVSGYDSVSYHSENQAIKGQKEFEYEWQGAVWRFSSASNLDLFKQDPERYAPQYGGYCAWAVSENKLASSDPEQFTIIGDKLYLNYNAKIQQKWLKDRDNLISVADQKWPNVLN
ncbi:YHS domain-containing protein [Alginatibacterium sediminis]|uniref:YHS domain-containing protein n=1 Tax=Alginatibacterium sediminis TaxID=2164068 RepID=A0A420E6P4_9ALTE|nr:YHS domain-containing (seleno)protein [Alginatibacterium sediminis]RKF14310.1 YHS domain-containing protein [Alginatibacterium sediminis]